MKKPVLAVAGLTMCSGCQLTLLNCEAELPKIAGCFEFAWFPMGISDINACGPIDVALVEGAVSTPEDLEILTLLRSRSRLLVAYGTCARWGGIAAMKNHESREPLLEQVYGTTSKQMTSFPPAPLHRFVPVDFSITGCPPEKGELLKTLGAILHGTLPVFPVYPVCTECRNRESLCLLIERNELCLGPIIQAGCNARCPAVGIKCEGCRGPVEEANVGAEIDLLIEKGFSCEEIISRMQRFCPEWNLEQRN